MALRLVLALGSLALTSGESLEAGDEALSTCAGTSEAALLQLDAKAKSRMPAWCFTLDCDGVLDACVAGNCCDYLPFCTPPSTTTSTTTSTKAPTSTTTRTTTAVPAPTTTTTTANVCPMAGLDEGPQAQEKLRPHPFVAAVAHSCEEACEMFVRKRDFYEIMNDLEARKDKLCTTCKETAFRGSAASPNPRIFQTVGTRLLNMKVGQVDYPVNVSVGYVKAPLMYSTPQRTAIYNTWFTIYQARIQPAPKGMIMVHQGGPMAHIDDSGPGIFVDYLEELQHYDLVSVDQRGMGLSYAGLLENFTTPESFDEFAAYLALPNSVWNSVGRVGMLAVGSVNDVNNVTHEAPCADLAAKAKNSWLLPTDYANHDEVKNYLNGKARWTSPCSAKFDRADGDGGSYNLLQYMGTQALAHDVEWLRWALGSPAISVLGFSYGTRFAAAYASQFPGAIQRVAVTGVEAPQPDLLEMARGSAANTAQVLGFIQSQCAESLECRHNPFNKTDKNLVTPPGRYFEGDINEAVNELFKRSADGGSWYSLHCPGKGLTTYQLTSFLAMFLTNLPPATWRPIYQDETWPVGFLMLPATVYLMLQNPCKFARDDPPDSGFGDLAIFFLIPALDMTGKWQLNQVAKEISSFAADRAFAPSLRMYLLYAQAAYGWPQLPTPIGFSHPSVNAVAVNPLYDQRTGMNNAQQFQLNFPNSSLVTSLSGGHCVQASADPSLTHGPAGYKVLMEFLFFGWKPTSGQVVGDFVKIDFAVGAKLAPAFLKT